MTDPVRRDDRDIVAHLRHEIYYGDGVSPDMAARIGAFTRKER